MNIKTLSKTMALSMVVLATTSAQAVFAADSAPDKLYSKGLDILGEIIKYYLMFGTLIWVLAILVTAFMMLGKSDNRGKEEAKEKLMTTIKTGLLVLLIPAIAAFLVSLVATNIIGEESLNGSILKWQLEEVQTQTSNSN